MPIDEPAIKQALYTYSSHILQTRRDPAHHPETSLYPHFDVVMQKLSVLLGYRIQIIQQYGQGEIGSPDFGIRSSKGTISFIEAKSPDKNINLFVGRDKQQFERYMQLGNVIFTNFWQVHLYQNVDLKARAELVPVQCLDPWESSGDSLRRHDIMPVINLLHRFFQFEIPHIRTIENLTSYLARATRLVRDAVWEIVQTKVGGSPLHEIYWEFRDVLFYELEPVEFADAYAQTLAYGLLLARQATQRELTAQNLSSFINGRSHRLLSATLSLLSQPPVVQMIGWTIDNLVTVVNHVSPNVLSASTYGSDPLLYFYEDFLAAYDPELRKRLGVYYTPPSVVRLQTRVIHHLLINQFGLRYGFADETVRTLDPAVGTGTYLIAALNLACHHIEQAMGSSSTPDAVSAIAKHLHGFEILVGPYTVAHYRMASAIAQWGGQNNERLPILLTDALLPVQAQLPRLQPSFGFMSAPLTAERRLADAVKRRRSIMVILGNPPYRRAKGEEGWLWGELLDSFRAPVRAEYSIDLKNLADLYVWFYRWAIWKLFETESAPKRGILSFISNSKWIVGGAFGGMRQVFRQYFDQIYIIDLHGDHRAPLPAGIYEDQNVFGIQVGVAICICIAHGNQASQEAEVYYYGDTWGLQEAKYAWLDSVSADLSNVPFEPVVGTGLDAFMPNLGERFHSWPHLKENIFVYSVSGVQTKRDHFVVAATSQKLQEQILQFLNAPVLQQRDIFHETRDKRYVPASQTPYDRSH